jgi:hypothetical protein
MQMIDSLCKQMKKLVIAAQRGNLTGQVTNLLV